MIDKGGRRKADGGTRFRGLTCAPTFPLPPSPLRPAFTLIELLVAISIIATLSALFLGASRAAMESSRASRTRATIDKLHTLVMERYADYETRRVDLDNHANNNVQALVNSLPAEGGHDIRLLALRELMKFEMPDRWSDIDITRNPTGKPAAWRDKATVFLKNVPTVTRIYYRRYDQALTNAGNDEAKLDAVQQNQGAECLFMTVMLHTGDGEARTMFSTQDIGDVDEDGLPEFLDGWGNPIEFIRWPAGFVDRSAVMTWNTSQQTGDSTNDHDPFDPFRRNWRIDFDSGEKDLTPRIEDYPDSVRLYIEALRKSTLVDGNKELGFRLVPLIVSKGPDGVIGLVTAREIVMGDRVGQYAGLLNPYFPTDDKKHYSMGAIYWGDGEDLSIDNLHNHLDTTR